MGVLGARGSPSDAYGVMSLDHCTFLQFWRPGISSWAQWVIFMLMTSSWMLHCRLLIDTLQRGMADVICTLCVPFFLSFFLDSDLVPNRSRPNQRICSVRHPPTTAQHRYTCCGMVPIVQVISNGFKVFRLLLLGQWCVSVRSSVTKRCNIGL